MICTLNDDGQLFMQPRTKVSCLHTYKNITYAFTSTASNVGVLMVIRN